MTENDIFYHLPQSVDVLHFYAALPAVVILYGRRSKLE